jgi:hypothetical protein
LILNLFFLVGSALSGGTNYLVVQDGWIGFGLVFSGFGFVFFGQCLLVVLFGLLDLVSFGYWIFETRLLFAFATQRCIR